MLKIKSIVCAHVNARDYEFYCNPDSPIQDALEANKQINAFLLGKLEQNKEAEKDCCSKQESTKNE